MNGSESLVFYTNYREEPDGALSGRRCIRPFPGALAEEEITGASGNEDVDSFYDNGDFIEEESSYNYIFGNDFDMEP